MHALRLLMRREVAAAWRYRWWALALSWAVCIGGWLVVATIPNQYEASARLYVDADAVLTPLLRGLAVDNSLASQLDVLQRTLLSRPNLEKLVSKTDLELQVGGAADLEGLVASLGTAIRIVPQTRNLFTITYRNSRPKLAFDVVKTILTTFIESKTGNNRNEMENAQTFLQQQIDSYERQLRAAEKRRADFRTKYIDLLPGDGVTVGTYGLDAARGNVKALDGQLVDARAQREMLAKELATTPPLLVTETDPGAGGGPGGGGGVSARLAAAQAQLDELRLRDTESHPDVIAARKLVDSIKAGAGGGLDPVVRPTSGAGPRSRSVANPVYEQLKVKLVDLDAQIASLGRRVGEATKDRDRLEEIARGAPGLMAELSNVNRDYDVLRRNYEEMLSRRESMRIAVAAEADADKIKMQIVDPPQVPQIPAAPKRGVLVSGVLAGGLAAGVGLAFLLVYFDRSFHTIDDLRDLGLPVIGGVSLFTTVAVRGRLLAAVTFASAVLLLGAAYVGLLYKLVAPGFV